MERLSALDASFLHLESERTPMHISSLAIYEGSPPGHGELSAMLERRLPLVPRFRQRLATVPLATHRPVFIDDERFDLEAHVQHVRLADGTKDDLLHLCGRILSQPLCHTRPLWEMWLVSGLDGDRFAVLSKTHHCLWDGVTGIDLHSVLLDDSPQGREDAPAPDFEPEPEPNGLGLLAGAIRDRLGEGIVMARALLDAAREPAAAFQGAREVVRDATSFLGSLLRPAPASELNVSIGSRRRFAIGRASLHEVKDLKHTLGASVNDVVLAATAGAIRQWQIHRSLEPQDVRVMVPVSVRQSDESGNRVAMVTIDLPVTDRTSLMRLDRVHHAMDDAKRSGHVAAADAITRLSGFLPTTAVAAMTKMQSMLRPFNVVVTNIPGPQQPLYLLGRKLLELYPQAPLAPHQTVSIAALSYNGAIYFGLLADYDSMPDADVLMRALEASIDELCDAGGLDAIVPAAPSLSRLAELATVH